MTTEPPGDPGGGVGHQADALARFRSDVTSFATDTGGVLRSVFSPELSAKVTHRENVAKSVIKADVPLYEALGEGEAGPKRRPLARLEVETWCCLDSSGKYLAVASSRYALVAELDRTPILRFEYDRDVTTKPGAHIQVHAHRGALSHLLSRTGHENPHSMESLHLPVGGDRFRVCLEDVLEFLIVECKFDKLPGWRVSLNDGRKRWRRFQLKSAVRDSPNVAVEALRSLGYTIEDPADGARPDDEVKAQTW